MEKKEISVNHQLIYKDFGDGYKFHINTPKTKTGRPLMPSAVNNVLYNIIDAYNKAEAGKAEKEHRTPVFLTKISSHSLRHTACVYDTLNLPKKSVRIP